MICKSSNDDRPPLYLVEPLSDAEITALKARWDSEFARGDAPIALTEATPAAGRPNLLALRCALEAALISVGDIRTETIKQANTLERAGLDAAEMVRSLATAERQLSTAFGEACASLNGKIR